MFAYFCLYPFFYKSNSSLLLLFNHSVSLQPHGLHHTRFPYSSHLPELAQTHGHWVSDAIQPSRSLSSPSPPAFNRSQHGGQNIGTSASASVLPMDIQDWFLLGWTGLISTLSKGLSRVFSNTTVQKHQFFSIQPSLCPNLVSIYDYWKNHSFYYMGLCQQSDVSAF